MIQISAFTGAYGQGVSSLNVGDQVQVEAWNPQTHAGPACYTATVITWPPTPGGGGGTTNPASGGNAYVALGDSYSAGQGLGDYSSDDQQAGDNCHRSAGAYPHILAADFAQLADLSFVACTGAVTYDLLNNAQRWSDKPPAQIASPPLGSATKVVTLTIGGNDASFVSVAWSCVTGWYPGFFPYGGDIPWAVTRLDGPISHWPCKNALSEAGVRAGVLSGIGTGGSDLSKTAPCPPFDLPLLPCLIGPGTGQKRPISRLLDIFQAILKYAPNAHLFVAGYPRFFGSYASDCVIGTASPLTALTWQVDRDRLSQIDNLVATIDNGIAIEAAAARKLNLNVTYVDVSPRFAGHRLCDTQEPWLNGANWKLNPAAGVLTTILDGVLNIALPPIVFTPDDSSFHPTRLGQCAYADAFRGAITKVMGWPSESITCGTANQSPITIPNVVYLDPVKGTIPVPFYTLGPARGYAVFHSRRYRQTVKLRPGWNRIILHVGRQLRPGRHQLVLHLHSGARWRTYSRMVTVRKLPRLHRVASRGKTVELASPIFGGS